MKKNYRIMIEPKAVTRQGLKNIEHFLDELSTIEGVKVSEEKLEFSCDSEIEDSIIQISEKYSIVNLIGF
ncbi:MAG: hypothetical protein IJ892_06480 [Prevotella sp.]|nr:hypothetical protein [Prevotella sp.]